MISLQISTGIKCIAVLMLQFSSGCDDGLTYDQHGQVIATAPAKDTLSAFLMDTALITTVSPAAAAAPISNDNADTAKINTKSLSPEVLVAYAETQIGVRYRYGSINPKVGFDCSGFITYVFNHFDIKVPRSSVDFTHIGKSIPLDKARQGDLVLFTGTNPNIRVVGHMGIIHTVDTSGIKFIHSSSGKANGVTITPLNGYYKGRFMSIRRIFPQNNS